jgi:hypothetical protein
MQNLLINFYLISQQLDATTHIFDMLKGTSETFQSQTAEGVLSLSLKPGLLLQLSTIIAGLLPFKILSSLADLLRLSSYTTITSVFPV